MRILRLLMVLGTAFASSAFAQDGADRLNLTLPGQSYRTDLLLAQNEVAGGAGSRQSPVPLGETPAKDRIFTTNKLHQYLGIGSIALAGLTILAPKEDGDSLHHELGQGAAVLGGAAVASGLIFHWEDFDLRKGFRDPDNLHMLLTTLGTLGYALAVSDAPESDHAAYGAIGAASMLMGIKLVW